MINLQKILKIIKKKKRGKKNLFGKVVSGGWLWKIPPGDRDEAERVYNI